MGSTSCTNLTMNTPYKSAPKATIKLLNRNELNRIRETLEEAGPLEDRLLYATMLTGMRISEYLPIESKDLGINSNFNATVKGLPIDFVHTATTLNEFNQKMTTPRYAFISPASSSRPLSIGEFLTKLRGWLSNAHVSSEKITPHTVRLSVISANAAVASTPRKEVDKVFDKNILRRIDN